MPNDTMIAPDRTIGRHRQLNLTAQLGWRVAAVLLAGALAFAAAPAWAATPVVVVAALGVTEWVVRFRRRGLVDAVLVGLSSLVIAAVLTGLLLNLLPTGLDHHTWAVAATLIGLFALALGRRNVMPPSLFTSIRTKPADRTSRLVGVITSAVAVLIVAGSLVSAVRSTNENQIDPVQLGATTTSTGATVSLSAGSTQGPYDVLLVTTTGTSVVASDLTVDANTVFTVAVAFPTADRVLVELVAAGDNVPLRELIFDGGVLASGTPE